MDQGCTDLEHYLLWPGGEVLDGLHPWNRHPSVTKGRHPGPLAQYRPLPVPGVPPWINLELSKILPWYAHIAPSPPAQEAVPRGHYFCLSLIGGAQESDVQMRAQLLDLIGDLVGHQCQGLSLEIPVQIPESPKQPSTQGEVDPGWVPVEEFNRGWHSGGVPLCV